MKEIDCMWNSRKKNSREISRFSSSGYWMNCLLLTDTVSIGGKTYLEGKIMSFLRGV